jgi:D-alanyl-D-alanine carboxypeptidase
VGIAYHVDFSPLHLPGDYMKLIRTLLSLCLLPLLSSAAGAAPPPPTPAQAVDAAVAQHLGASFNGVVLLRKAGSDVALVRAYGLANAEKNVAMTPATPFQIGSISKWLTAVAVLRLVDQGKLTLDAPVKSVLPELPAHTGAITLRQLLSNSAGIPNGVMQEFKKDNTIADLRLTALQASQRFASGALLFAPGTSWEYSPTTWVVVAAMVERASGKPFAEAMDELVLGPAKASGTAVPALPFKDLPGAALAYKGALEKSPRELNVPPHVTFVAASGTVYSNADDLARLAQTVYDTPLLSPGARGELMRVMVPAQHYALGGRVLTMELGGRERSVAWETGASAGYKSLLAYVPGEGKTVVILNNTGMDQAVLATAAEAMLKALY